MDSSLSILGVIAFVLFHVLVTLPLATLTTRELVWPWLQQAARRGGGSGKEGGAGAGAAAAVPEWAVTAVLFVLMALAFALRGHVVAASGAKHVHEARVHAAHHAS